MANEIQQTTSAQTKVHPVIAFKNIVDDDYFKTQIKNVLGERSGQFTTSLIEVFTNDKTLHECNPKAVAQEAIKACCMGLPLAKALGYAYILPFKNKGVATPTLVLGFKGIMKLAQNTGKYKTINADVVYEGELVKKNKLTGYIDLDGERTSDKVLGFFAYFELINGSSHTLYMSAKEMAHYAKTYAPTLKFNNSITEDKLVELMQDQAVNGPKSGTGWLADTISMSIKTVIRRLLTKWGDLSIEDKAMEYLTQDELPTPAQQRDELNEAPKPVFNAHNIEDAEAEEVDEPNPFEGK